MTERRLTPSEPATSSSPTGRPGHGGADRHHRQREEHDGVGDHQQGARLVEAALQEVLGHVGEAQRDHQAGHGEDHEVRSLQAEHPAPREAHRQEGDRHRGQRRHDTGCRRVPERVQRRVGQGRRRRQRAASPLEQQIDDGSHRDAERQHDQQADTAERHRPEATQRERGGAARAAPAPSRDVRPCPRTVSSLASSSAAQEHQDEREGTGGRLVEADLELVVDLGRQRLVAQDLEGAELGQHDQARPGSRPRRWPGAPAPP